MTTFRTIILTLGAIGFLIPAPVAFGQCVEFPNVKEAFARADAVFVGTVVAHQPTGNVGAHVIVDVATVRLEESWKGTAEREVRVSADQPLLAQHRVDRGGKCSAQLEAFTLEGGEPAVVTRRATRSWDRHRTLAAQEAKQPARLFRP